MTIGFSDGTQVEDWPTFYAQGVQKTDPEQEGYSRNVVHSIQRIRTEGDNSNTPDSLIPGMVPNPYEKGWVPYASLGVNPAPSKVMKNNEMTDEDDESQEKRDGLHDYQMQLMQGPKDQFNPDNTSAPLGPNEWQPTGIMHPGDPTLKTYWGKLT